MLIIVILWLFFSTKSTKSKCGKLFVVCGNVDNHYWCCNEYYINQKLNLLKISASAIKWFKKQLLKTLFVDISYFACMPSRAC